MANEQWHALLARVEQLENERAVDNAEKAELKKVLTGIVLHGKALGQTIRTMSRDVSDLAGEVKKLRKEAKMLAEKRRAE